MAIQAHYGLSYTGQEVENLLNSVSTLQNDQVVYCWGDSLTQGEGSNLKLADGVFETYNLHPYTKELTNFKHINLGCQGETLTTIMARQGADPMVVGGFTIPADCTPVVVGTRTAGIATAAGGVAVPLQPNEAGINPCVIAGVEGTLHRGSSVNDSDMNYYFTRSKAGKAVSVSTGTKIETFAMRNYRNGIAVIWAGANGGWSNVTDYINKLKTMITYGNYSNYLIVTAREVQYDNDLASMQQAFTDENNVCHYLSLIEPLCQHGLTLANMVHYYFDTSGYANGDKILLKAPMLCAVNADKTFQALHFSAYGYKAIGKLVQAKLIELTNGPSYRTNSYDAFGHMVWELTKPYSCVDGRIIDTKWCPYDTSKNWTIAIKFKQDIDSDETYGSIFEARDDTAGTSLFLRLDESGTSPQLQINMGPGYGFAFLKSGGFFEWVGGDFSTDGYHYLVLSNNNGNYVVAFDGGVLNGYGAALADGVASDMPLILFGREMSANNFAQLTRGEITKFKIYDTNFDSTTCTAILNDMKV